MTGLEPVGRALLVAGVALVVLGLVFVLGSRVPLLGRLPGDITIERGGVTIYIPLASMLLVSAILSLCLSFFGGRR